MLRHSVFMPRQSLVKTKSFYVMIELAKVKRNYVATKCFVLRQSLVKARSFYVMTQYFVSR